MYDFAKWACAAAPGFGWTQGEFLAAYDDNRRDTAEVTFEADQIAVAIFNWITSATLERWEGSATELLGVLSNHVSEGIKKSKWWPQSAAQLGSRLVRAMPPLKSKGVIVERRHSGDRIITILAPGVAL
jgi:hypothetical protein